MKLSWGKSILVKELMTHCRTKKPYESVKFAPGGTSYGGGGPHVKGGEPHMDHQNVFRLKI